MALVFYFFLLSRVLNFSRNIVCKFIHKYLYWMFRIQYSTLVSELGHAYDKNNLNQDLNSNFGFLPSQMKVSFCFALLFT